MTNLMGMIEAAEEVKPAMGRPCNHCGWCCLTEVCQVGRELTGTTVIPCGLLRSEGEKHYCSVAKSDEGKESIGAGVGCCAMTQREVLATVL